jgi:ketosteroid isomerase-like protein
MSDEVDLLKHVYERFNARDMKTVLAAMHDDVMWANGMEGGHVRGRDEVRSDASVDDDRSARRAGRVRLRARRGGGCGSTSGCARPQRQSSGG